MLKNSEIHEFWTSRELNKLTKITTDDEIKKYEELQKEYDILKKKFGNIYNQMVDLKIKHQIE